MINLKHVPSILAIVREGNITAASKKLFVSQPALSQTIRQVEEELGAPIFRRDTRRMELTHAGELYLKAAQEMMNIDRNLHAYVEDSKGDVYGELNVGISNQRGIQLLPKVIPEHFRKYPHVKISLLEEGSVRLEHMVREGSCDIAFVTTKGNYSDMQYVLIENEEMVLLANRSTKLAQRFPDKTPLNIAEARNERFISMAQGHSMRLIQSRLFEKYDMNPEIVLEAHNIEAAKAITARTDAVFLIPGVYVPDTMPDRYRVNIYPISDTGFERPFYFCYRKNTYLTQYMKDLVGLVCEKLEVPFNLDIT